MADSSERNNLNGVVEEPSEIQVDTSSRIINE
jgi:hypothetical protein